MRRRVLHSATARPLPLPLLQLAARGLGTSVSNGTGATMGCAQLTLRSGPGHHATPLGCLQGCEVLGRQQGNQPSRLRYVWEKPQSTRESSECLFMGTHAHLSVGKQQKMTARGLTIAQGGTGSWPFTLCTGPYCGTFQNVQFASNKNALENGGEACGKEQ